MMDIVDSVLRFLADQLPASAYDLLISALSHCIALAQAVYSLTANLLAKNPAEWNAQTVLPPFIAFVAAYMALVSLYRTTTWMLRTGIFFAKWGIIFGVIMAAAGWLTGTQQASSGGEALGSASRTPRTTESKRNLPKRPRVWESFDRHRTWNQPPVDNQVDPIAIINSITQWWDQARNIIAEPEDKAGRGKTSVSR